MPNIICGPILRRVEKRKVSVWIACSESQHLKLDLYEGDGIDATSLPDDSNRVGMGETVTVRFGKNLWIGLITAETTVLPLQAGQIYSYNIRISGVDTPGDGDLRSEGMLEDKDHLERPQKALGFSKNKLPTFLLPAEDPKDLFIAHASCRKMHGHGLDALAHLDGIIKKSFELPTPPPPTGDKSFMLKRPQQLFLTGDQIYADDMPGMLLDVAGKLDFGTLVGEEKVQVRLNNSASIEEVNAGTFNFPPLIRSHLINEYGGFTSGSSHNHLISFEEFAGTYLNYWSIRSWNLDFYKEIKRIQTEIKKVAGGKEKTVAAEIAGKFLEDTSTPDNQGLIKRIRDEGNLRGNATQFVFDEKLNKIFKDTSSTEKLEHWKKDATKRLIGELLRITEFATSLPVVSRVLANTPTYMVFDDHEITDDWNLSKSWQNQVLSKPLGRDLIRNGLMAYTVFQDWGNVPDEYVAIEPTGGDTGPITPKTRLIRKISEMGFRFGHNINVAGIRDDIYVPIENLLGMGEDPAEVKWHYEVETGPTKTYVLDTRTQREFPSLNSPPGLINESAIAEQIPDTIPFGNAPFSFVISAAPVFGLQSFEELIQPAAASVVGIKTTTGPNPGILQGQIKYDFEAWGFNSVAFENLVQRMAKLEKVIVLSGDVHYGFSSVLDYWEGSTTTPKARMLQLTASSLKNETFGFDHLYRSALADKILTGIGDKLEKLVWVNKVLSVSGEVSIRNRHRLRQTPAVVPTAGWQPGATVSQPPDYRYRLTVQTDETDREGDPVTAELVLTNAASVKEGYKQIVQRSQENFISGVHRRMVWPSNVGLITFEADGESWKVKHEFLYRKGDRDPSKKKVGTHMKHIMPLVASGTETSRPELS